MEISHEWSFGDDRELADRLKGLVLSGKKKATTGLLYEGKRIPKIGEYEAILDSNGNRFCVIRITNIEIKPFWDVDYDFVLKEGEGDRDIEEWRSNFRKLFDLKDDDVEVICEEFELVEGE